MNQRQQSGRLLVHWSGDAGWNMAVDQAIAEAVSAGSSDAVPPKPTLRFYTWGQPTLSLGYFQSAADSEPRFRSLCRVRRSTGGGAILHDRELTYSLVFPTPVGQHGARSDLYRTVHEAFVDVLSDLGVNAQPHRTLASAPAATTGQNVPEPNSDSLNGVKLKRAAVDRPKGSPSSPFLCFQRRTDEDLIVSGYKVLGSAQRRVKAAILQHGSLLLHSSHLAAELPGVFDLTSQSLSTAMLTSALTAEIGDRLGIKFDTGPLSKQEADRADRIDSDRFSSQQWWLRR